MIFAAFVSLVSPVLAQNWATYPQVPKTASINGFADPIYANLPDCAHSCVKEKTDNTPCPYWDTGCLCIMAQWTDIVAECIASQCQGKDVSKATSLASSLCHSAGAWFTIDPSQSKALDAAANKQAAATSATSAQEAGSTSKAAASPAPTKTDSASTAAAESPSKAESTPATTPAAESSTAAKPSASSAKPAESSNGEKKSESAEKPAASESKASSAAGGANKSGAPTSEGASKSQDSSAKKTSASSPSKNTASSVALSNSATQLGVATLGSLAVVLVHLL